MKLSYTTLLVVIAFCLEFFSCKKNNSSSTTTTATTSGTYSFICWNTTAGIFTNFRSNNTRYPEKWDFGDGNTLSLPLGSGAGSVGPIDHIYAAPGAYTVTLTVNNDSSLKVSQVDTITPNYYFNYRGVPIVGDTIYFYFSAFLPTGVNYLWTFGDGSSSTDSIPYHLYNSNGNFDVKLTINGNPANPDVWLVVPIYQDPVYTHEMTTSRLWKSTSHSYNVGDSSSYNVYTTLPDTTFSLTYINEVNVALASIDFTYTPSLSSIDTIVFSITLGSVTTPCTVYYNHISDSISVSVCRLIQYSPGSPTIELDQNWHSP
jgi:hypothetical protein